MAVIFIEGFDKYGPAGQTTPSLTNTLLFTGEWNNINSNNGSISIVAGLGPTGQALQFLQGNPTSPFITKTFAGTAARLIGGFRFNANLSVSTSFFQATKAGGAVFCLTLPTSGVWSLRTGGTGGTILGSAAAISASTTHYLEFDITIGASNSYQVWIDGASVIGPSTGNTGNGQTLVDGIQFGIATGGGGATTIQFDDLYIFDGTGTTNKAPLLTNPCVETSIPSSDVQTQWANNGSVLGTNNSASGSTNAPGANEIFLRKFTPSSNQTLASVSCIPGATSAAAKFKAVIYPDSGGSPNGQALTATGNEVVGTTSAVTLTSAFASPPSLTSGTPYWIGFITDTSVVLHQVDATTTGVKAANTYASGAPSTCPTVTTGQVSWELWGNCTGSTVNWVSENQNPGPGDGSSIISTTVGNEDLYGFTALTNTPVSIYTVAVKASVRVAGTGARTIDLRTKSSTFDSAGSNPGLSPATSYNWLDSYFDTDPDGGGAWTGTKLNAASSGIKVAS